MTKKIIYTFLFLSMNVFSQKQVSGGEINYEITMKVDEDKLKAVSKKVDGSKYAKDMAISTIKNQGKANFKLRFNKNASVFKEDKKLKINERKINLIKIMIGKGVFYTDKNAKKIVHQKEAFGELFLIDVPKVKWNLTQETKKIGNYICYKANTEKEGENKRGTFVKKITAWYTPELPVNYGPKDYFGLPGLIIELREGPLLYRASEINISLKKNIQIQKPTKGKKVTLEQYNDIAKEMIHNYHKR
ncbi:MAG: GLPGLI family protein [Flavobacteriaceae bacterium]|nr:MAG: GLPGLI family protein [Flavobacteriaceae bacterium]QMU66721.1 MAG: GLPGLI family protein [Flavobacteriaceae bacterium]